jgi:hypothetical protein
LINVKILLSLLKFILLGLIKMNDELELLGYCGLYCGACTRYHSSLPDGKNILEDAMSKCYMLHEGNCTGCRGKSESMCVKCFICDIKKCAISEEIEHCGLCHNFPCEKIIEFQNESHSIHHIEVIDNLNELKDKDSKKWLEEQQKKWTCICGKHFSWYEINCSNCGNNLKTYATGNKNNE